MGTLRCGSTTSCGSGGSADGLARICFNMALIGSHMDPQVSVRVEGFAHGTSTLSACLVTCLSHAMFDKQAFEGFAQRTLTLCQHDNESSAPTSGKRDCSCR